MPADIILLAAIAAFVLLRLRGVLGQKIGHDQPPSAKPDVTRKEGERVIQIKMADPAAPTPEATEPVFEEEPRGVYGAAVEAGMDAVRAVDREFRLKEFLAGANVAFDMVHEAFRKDDRETLKSLLSKEMYKEFAAALDGRKGAVEHEESTLISVASVTPTTVEVEKNKARITLDFVSEQMTVRRNDKGAAIEGSSSPVQKVEDVWTFERDLRSSNPNWTIVAT